MIQIIFRYALSFSLQFQILRSFSGGMIILLVVYSLELLIIFEACISLPVRWDLDLQLREPPKSCRYLVPDQEIEPRSPAVGAQENLSHWTTRKPLSHLLIFYMKFTNPSNFK